MKALRIFVLVLLAVLLPLRGVAAAAAVCGQQAASHTHTVAPSHGHEAHGTASQDDACASQDHDGCDNARHCASSCAATPLMSAWSALVAPSAESSTVFPRFVAPAATFQSGGQDRPPRSS